MNGKFGSSCEPFLHSVPFGRETRASKIDRIFECCYKIVVDQRLFDFTAQQTSAFSIELCALSSFIEAKVYRSEKVLNEVLNDILQ